MRLDAAVLERIVADVMAQIATRQMPASAHTQDAQRASAGLPSMSANVAKTTTAAPRLLTDKIITEELLERVWNGETQLKICRQSIITPTGQDFLRIRKINWSRADSRAEVTPSEFADWLAITVRSTPAVSQVIDHLQTASDVRWKTQLLGGTDEAVAGAIGAICRAEAAGVVVLTQSTAAVACLSNRNRSIRAAVIQDAQSIDVVKRDLSPNVFVLDPTGKSFFEMRQLTKVLSAGGTPQAPHGWHD